MTIAPQFTSPSMRPKRYFDGSNGGGDRVRFGQVENESRGPGNIGGGFAQGPLADVGKGHARAARGQKPGRRPADAPSGSGDQNRLPRMRRKVRHATPRKRRMRSARRELPHSCFISRKKMSEDT